MYVVVCDCHHHPRGGDVILSVIQMGKPRLKDGKQPAYVIAGEEGKELSNMAVTSWAF